MLGYHCNYLYDIMYNVLEYSCEKGVHWQVEGFWGRGMFFYMSVEEMGLSVSGEGIYI